MSEEFSRDGEYGAAELAVEKKISAWVDEIEQAYDGHEDVYEDIYPVFAKIDPIFHPKIALELLRRRRANVLVDYTTDNTNENALLRGFNQEVAKRLLDEDIPWPFSGGSWPRFILERLGCFLPPARRAIGRYLLEKGLDDEVREYLLVFSEDVDEELLLSFGKSLTLDTFWKSLLSKKFLKGELTEDQKERSVAAWIVDAYSTPSKTVGTLCSPDKALDRVLRRVATFPEVQEAKAHRLLRDGSLGAAMEELYYNGARHVYRPRVWNGVEAKSYLSQEQFREDWRLGAVEAFIYFSRTDEEDQRACVPYTKWAKEVGGMSESEIVNAAERALEEVLYKYPDRENVRFLEKQFPTIFESDPFKKTALQLLDDAEIELSIRRSKEFSTKLLDPNTPREALTARQGYFLSPAEYTYIQETAPIALTPDERGKLRFTDMVEPLMEWMRMSGEDSSIIDAFKQGVALFGAATMIRYTNRPDLRRHDALHFMPAIMALRERSGLSPAVFSSSILEQVAADDAAYESGTAHHHFAAVVQALQGVDIGGTIEKATAYAGRIDKLALLAGEFTDLSTSPFASWKRLKKFKEMVDILGRADLLEKLVNEPNKRMRAYIEALAFHPNIALDKVMQFWQETGKVLEVDDEHTPVALREVKKPSQLLEVPNLGWKPSDLRDALVGREGEEKSIMDQLQALPAMECTYRIGPELRVAQRSKDPAVIHAMLVDGIGRLREKRPGIAKKPKQLLAAVQGFCKDWAPRMPHLSHELTFEHLVKSAEFGRVIVAELPAEALEALKDLVFHEEYGVELRVEDTRPVYRARLGWKSDPSIAVAGNDTASCMPFGSGKNNHYMFNPNCAQLIVERQTSSGEWRTAAQSVVTLDYRVSKPIAEIVEAYQSESTRLHDLVDQQELVQKPVIACDNIEVAKNEEGNRVAVIEEVYRRFWGEYLEKHAASLDIDPSRVPIGMGYTPAGFTFTKETNHYVPAVPMGYSDNAGKDCFVIETKLPRHTSEERERPATSPVTVRDVLACAYLEGKAFANNPGLVTHLHGMQNKIISVAMANTYFDRPNLAFLYRTPDLVPRGYLFAYEGVTEKEELPFVYIEDFAADQETKIAGGRLLLQFFEAFQQAYVDKTPQEPIPPIFTNARESTSYQMIRTHLARLAGKLGVRYELLELGVHTQSEESFHDVAIIFGRTQEELQQQKERYQGKFS